MMYAVAPTTAAVARPIATASELLAPAAFAIPPESVPAPTPNSTPFPAGDRFSHPVKRRPDTTMAAEDLIRRAFIR
jgi:hypothetical protein